MKSLALSVLMLCVLTPTVAAADQRELEKVLNDHYGGKTLHLRHFFKSGSQEYDAQGTPLRAGDEGPWTLYGGMAVKKISVGDDSLSVEGNRAAYMFDEREKRLAPVRAREELRIKIRLNAPLTTADEGVSVLERVFALTSDVVLNSVPPPWQDYLKQQLDPQPTPVSAENAGADRKLPPVNTNADAPMFFKPGETGGRVTPPKILFKPEPVFSNAARNNHVQGIVGLRLVVGSGGRVDQVRIVKPMGMGLDENAIEAVKTWRFQPATKDGVPVPVAVYIEVDYHFYEGR